MNYPSKGSGLLLNGCVPCSLTKSYNVFYAICAYHMANGHSRKHIECGALNGSVSFRDAITYKVRKICKKKGVFCTVFDFKCLSQKALLQKKSRPRKPTFFNISGGKSRLLVSEMKAA